MGDGEALRQNFEFSGGLLARNTGFQTPGNAEPMPIARGGVGKLLDQLRKIAEGNPELRIEDQVESSEFARRHPDHSKRMAGE